MTAQRKLFKVLVIGDVCDDVYYKCRNTRLNPESSAPLVQVTSTYRKLGMAANVRLCLENLGMEAYIIGSTYNSTKTRYIDAKTNQQLLRVDFEDKVEPIDIKVLTSELLSKYDAVVIADYNKGFLDYAAINYIAKVYKGPVFLDTKKRFLDNFNPRIFIKINELEANSASVVPEHTIVTLGANGVKWFDEHWPAYKSESVDVCGAGDAFMAGIVYGYLTDQFNMVEYGIVNAGISVRHVGTYSPTLQELKQGFDDYYNKQSRYN